MKVEIWSDVVCPWCYVGKRHLEAALALFPRRDHVEVSWRAFELDPSAPPVREGDYVSRLARKYGVDVVEARRMIDRMVATGAKAGLEMRFDVARPGNTFDAHRLIHLAGTRGLQDAVTERLFAATFSEGEAMGDREALLRLGVEAGLDPADVRTVLWTDRYAGDVRADEAEAARLGITGVPCFVVDRRYAVSGAQPPELLLEVFQRAWRDAEVGTSMAGRDAAACRDGDACAI